MAIIENVKKQNPDNKGQAMVETLFSMMLMIALILGTFQVGLIGSGQMLTIVAAHRAARANQIGEDVLQEYDSYSWGGGMFGSDNIPNMLGKHQGLKTGFGMGFGGPTLEPADDEGDEFNKVKAEVGQNFLLKAIPFFETGSGLGGGWFSDVNLITGGIDNSGIGIGWEAPIQHVVFAEMPRVWEDSRDYDAENPY